MDPIKKNIRLAKQGRNPLLVATLKGGYVVMGKTQFLPGYCLLLPQRPVKSLNSLTLPARSQFLTDMSIVGDALLHVTAAQRINYEILGNTSNYLHAHIFPRYANEPLVRLKLPVWLYSKRHWLNPKYWYHQDRDGRLKQQLTNYLREGRV